MEFERKWIVLILVLFVSLSFYRQVTSKMISAFCTTNSLVGTSTNMPEGVPLNFTVVAYNQDCEVSPCVRNFACSLSCPSCSYYSGSPHFEFELVDSANATVPNVTCSVGNMTNVGQFPASCLATNSDASNSTHFQLQMIITETGNVFSAYTADIVLSSGQVLIISNCIAAWEGGLNSSAAGTRASLQVFLKDAYNNSFIPKNSSAIDFGLQATVLDNSGNNRSVPDPMISSVIYPDLGLSGDIYVPACTAIWKNEVDPLVAGSTAVIRIQLMDAYQNSVSLINGRDDYFNFTVSVQGKVGNSKYVADITMVSEGGATGYQNITFTAIKAGKFFLQIGDGADWISNSPLSYRVIADVHSAPACKAKWVGGVNTFKAGSQAVLKILLMDAYNNNVSIVNGRFDNNTFDIRVSGTSPGSNAITDVRIVNDAFGYASVSFKTRLSGNLELKVTSSNEEINNSPLPFTVTPGPISISHCTGEWKYGANEVQVLSKLSFIITQRDKYENPVFGLYYFFVEAFDVDNNLSLPIDDLSMKHVDGRSTEHIALTYTVRDLGDMLLSIGSETENISGSPFSYYSFPGNIEPAQTNCTGLGLNDSTSGDISVIYIQLQDIFGEPATCLSTNISVKVQLVSSSSVQLEASVIEDISNPNNTGLYQATYTSQTAGTYEIIMYWTNQLICKGYKKTVFAGQVSNGNSDVVAPTGYPYVHLNIWCKVFIELRDSFRNFVPNQLSSIDITISGPGNFTKLDFVADGEVYMAMVMMIDVGSYHFSIGFDTVNVGFNVTAEPESFFPVANNDVIWTWEEVSMGIDVLANDYVSSGKKTLKGVSQLSQHGSLVVSGGIIHYTPWIGYSGPDQFTYVLSDERFIDAEANVSISVWMLPPQVVSWPSALQALEGQPVPVQGGFGGFQVAYTDELAILDVNLQAGHGLLYLPADTIQLWYSEGYQSSGYTSVGVNPSLSFSGSLKSVNKVLQSLRYIGKQYYNGNDTILLSVIDSSGRGDEALVMVTVIAVNDPPFITAPSYMLVDNATGKLTGFVGSTIFFTVKSAVPGITVGDPDQKDKRVDGILFQLEAILQVTDGTIQVTLPISTVTTAETRDADDYLWKPLDQAVFSSNAYNMTGQGLKFRASVEDCNQALASLRYNGSASGVALSLVIDDMGNFGCYKDCTHNFPVPLLAETKIVVFPKRPLSRWWAYIKTARVFAAMVGSIGAAGLSLLCLVCYLAKLAAKKRKLAEALNQADMKEDQACEESRVYNPIWVPCTVSEFGSNFVSTPNPSLVLRRQGELRQKLQDVEMKIKRMALTGYKKIAHNH